MGPHLVRYVHVWSRVSRHAFSGDGLEGDVFSDIFSAQTISEPVMTLSYCDPCILSNVSIDNAQDRALDLESNAHLQITGLHLESHSFVSSGTQAINLSGSSAIINGLSYSGTVPSGFPETVILNPSASPVYVSISNVTISPVALAGGASLALISEGGNTGTIASVQGYTLANGATLFPASSNINNSSFVFGNTPAVSLAGTSGTASCLQSMEGALKLASCYLNAYANTGAAQTWNYPTAFSAVPSIQLGGGSCGMFNPTSTASILTLPANAAMTTETCNIVLIGQ